MLTVTLQRAGQLLAWFCVCTCRRSRGRVLLLARRHSRAGWALPVDLDLAQVAGKGIAVRATSCRRARVRRRSRSERALDHFIVADVFATAARAVGLYYVVALTQPPTCCLVEPEHGSVALLVTGGVACHGVALASRLMRERRSDGHRPLSGWSGSVDTCRTYEIK